MGRGAGQPYQLRPTHRRWLREAFDHGALTVVISGPRGMGKTGWMAPVGVWALFDIPGAQVIFASTSMRTAMQGYGRAVRIIELSPRLSSQAMVYRNKADPWTELPMRGSEMRPLPAEEKYIVGQAPTIILIDEVGYVDRDTYEAMQTSLGKSDGTVMVAFGTPGLGPVDSDSTPNIMYQLRGQATGAEPPPGLRYVEHAARPGDDPSRRATWKRANPLLGDLVDDRAVALDYATMPPNRFGQMRLGLWTQHERAWMSVTAWDALPVQAGELGAGALIALGFDGSVSRDSSALVAYEATSGRVVVLGHWTGPDLIAEARREEVMATIEAAFSRYTVTQMYADPWYWRVELEQLGARVNTPDNPNALQLYNTASISRMAPASDAFLSAVLRRELTTDGHAQLRAHVLNAVAKRTAMGDVITRDARRPRDTDLATAAILAYEAARTWEEPQQGQIW